MISPLSLNHQNVKLNESGSCLSNESQQNGTNQATL